MTDSEFITNYLNVDVTRLRNVSFVKVCIPLLSQLRFSRDSRAVEAPTKGVSFSESVWNGDYYVTL